MSDYYSQSQRALQDKFDTRRLADTIAGGLIHSELHPPEVQMIANSDMVFVSTVNQQGSADRVLQRRRYRLRQSD